MKNHPLRYGHVIAACSLAAIIITVSIVCFTPSLAQQSQKESGDKPGPKKQSPVTRERTSIIIIDSNGVRREYTSADDLPPRERKKLQQSLEQAETGLRRAEGAMNAARIPKPPAAPGAIIETIETPEPPGLAGMPVPAEPPLPPIVDWADIGSQVDSAMARVDWKAINRDISKCLVVAEGTITDPRVKLEIRRSMATARRQMAMAMEDRERMLADGRREVEHARGDMERARREMQRARKEMEQARAELERQKEALQDRQKRRR
jgi:hypothetical protein